MQKQCDAAEVRMQAARKAFDKARKPLEAAVRLQREELAKRKVRGQGPKCDRSLLTQNITFETIHMFACVYSCSGVSNASAAG